MSFTRNKISTVEVLNESATSSSIPLAESFSVKISAIEVLNESSTPSSISLAQSFYGILGINDNQPRRFGVKCLASLALRSAFSKPSRDSQARFRDFPFVNFT